MYTVRGGHGAPTQRAGAQGTDERAPPPPQIRNRALLHQILGVDESRQRRVSYDAVLHGGCLAAEEVRGGSARDLARASAPLSSSLTGGGHLRPAQWWNLHATPRAAAPGGSPAPRGCVTPRGLPARQLVSLLREITDLQPWQLWDIRHLLDPHALAAVSAGAGPPHAPAALLQPEPPTARRGPPRPARRQSSRPPTGSNDDLPPPQVDCQEFCLLMLMLGAETPSQRACLLQRQGHLLYRTFAGEGGARDPAAARARVAAWGANCCLGRLQGSCCGELRRGAPQEQQRCTL
jgi:hypothetical protein